MHSFPGIISDPRSDRRCMSHENINLVAKSINNILDFLEVAWSKNILEFYKTAPVDRLINTPSYDQVNKPIYKKSLDKWKNYKDQMQNVLPILNKWVEKYNYS